jgi:hypothetical protein
VTCEILLFKQRMSLDKNSAVSVDPQLQHFIEVETQKQRFQVRKLRKLSILKYEHINRICTFTAAILQR